MIAKQKTVLRMLFGSAGLFWITGLVLISSGPTFTPPAWATDVFSLGTVNGIAGTSGIMVPLEATHDEPMQGFSVALSFDPLPIDAIGVEVGSAVDALLAGGAPDYFEVTIDNAAGNIRAGVIFGFSAVPPFNQLPELPAAPGSPDQLLNLIFDINPGVLPSTVPLVLEPSLGTPSIDTVYSYNGFSRVPALEDGSIEVNTEVRFYFDPVSIVPGGSMTLVLRCDHALEELGGFQIALTYDSTKLTLAPPPSLDDYWAGTQLATGIAPETIELFEVFTQAAVPPPGVGFFAVGAIFDATSPLLMQSIDPGLGHSLLRIPFDVINDPALIGTTTEVEFTAGVSPANPGGPPLPPADNVVITTSGSGIPPLTDDGVITFVATAIFRRGDSNNDGALDVGDPIFFLGFLFSNGPTPVCGDATDVNDDGNGDIGDAVFALSYLFSNGPPPPPPFPGCGIDSTPSTNLPPCPAGTLNCP